MFLQEYEKIRLIGKGAFASVYKVRHANLGYIRALKVCNDFIENENDRAWQTFVSECKVLLRIGNGSHPNIVRIYQPRLLDNRAVVEMDCVEGESLFEYIRENRFIPVNEFYRFAKQIIGAVAYCHVDVYKFLMNPVEDKLDINPNDGRKYLVTPDKKKELIEKYGVVHNDLHSGNIIRKDYDGQYVLLDFGLAIQDSHCVKSSSRFDGAIEYCAPEKLEHKHVSTQSDVYALGILLYEMLAGRVPFPYSNNDGSTPESARSRVYMQHLKDTPPSIYNLRQQAFETIHPGQSYVQDYPQELEMMIMKCLAKNPSERYTDAKELLKAFKECIQITQISDSSDNPSSDTTSAPKPCPDSSDLQSIVEEMRKLREEVETLRSNHQVSRQSVSERIEIKNNNQNIRRSGITDWLFSNLNWLWLVILGVTWAMGGTCIGWKNYSDSELLGAVSICVGTMCVTYPWIFRWKSLTANLFMIILWATSAITSIVFTSDPVEPFMIIFGGVGLLSLIVVTIFTNRLH